MERKRPSKLGFAPLALLDWLCEAPRGDRLFSEGGGMSTRHLWLFEAGAAGPDGRRPLTRIIPGVRNGEDAAMLERLGGRASFDATGLVREGFERYQEMSDRRAAKPGEAWESLARRYDAKWFAYSDNVYLPTEAAYEYWRAEGRDRLASLRSERAEERRLADRTVLLRGSWRPAFRADAELARLLPRDFRMPVREEAFDRPYATARVVKATATRLYVEDVRRLDAPGQGSWADDVVRNGADGARWVDPAAVWLDPATGRGVRALREAADDYAQGAADAFAETLRAIAPALASLQARVAQKAAMRDDEVRAALAAAAEPDGDEAEDEPGQPAP